MVCEYRDEIVEVIQQVYWLKYNQKHPDAPSLKVFGVSAKLQEFCTTEKDLQRSINRMPNDHYLVNGEKPDEKNAAGDAAYPDDDELDDLFDFVIIDKE